MFFLYTSSLGAQSNFIETKNEINAFEVTKDENNLVFISNNKLYWTDIEDMKVIDSFSFKNQNEYFISDIKIKDDKSVVLLKQQPINRLATYDFLEYPQDSIHMFNFNQKKITGSIPGNYYLDFFENQETTIISGYNDYYKYQDDYGTSNYSPLKGKITAYPSELSVESPGVIRFLKKHPTKKEFILIYFFRDENKNSQYVFEIRNSETLEVIRNKKLTASNIQSVHCSRDGSIWNIIDLENYSKTNSFFYDYETLDEIKELDPNTIFPGWMIEQKIVTKVDNDLVLYNANTLELENRIWSNLTNFLSINGYYALNSNSILIFGEKSSFNESTKNGIQKILLNQDGIYTKVRKVDVTGTLFDPNIALLTTNVLNDENYTEIHYYEDLMLIKYDRSVEFWNIDKQKKWRSFSFSKKAYTHYNEKEKQLLIFEEAETKNSSDFIVRIVDIRTGVVKSKLFENKPFPFVNPLSTSYKFIPTDMPNQWIGRDYNSIWLFDVQKLEFSLVKTLENNLKPNEIIGFQNNKLLFSLDEIIKNNEGFDRYIKKGLFWLDVNTIEIEKISDSEEWDSVYLLTNNNLSFTSKNNFYYLKNSQKQKITSFENSYKSLKINKKGLWLQTSKGITVIDSAGNKKNIVVNETMKNGGFNLNSTDAFILTYDNLYTYHTEADFLDKWKILKNKKLLYPESQIKLHTSGKILWHNRFLVDTKTLTTAERLDNDSYLFDKLPYIVQKKFNDETRKYHIYIYDFDEAHKQIWMSTALPEKEFYYQINNFIFSESENQMIGYQNGYFQLTNVNYFFWADWKKNSSKVIETKKNISNVKKTINSEIIEIVFKDNESYYFNIISGNWVKDYSKASNIVNKPIINSQNIEWKDKNGTTKNFYSREFLECSFYSANLDKLIAGSESGKVFIWDLDNSTPKEIIITGTSKPIVRIIEKDNQLIAIDNLGSIHFIDNSDFKWKLSLFINEYEKDKYATLWYTSEGFYSAEKSALRNFHFSKQDKILPLNIYDAYLNRPEKVLENFTNSDTSIWDLYKEATQKRMKKLGVSDATDFWDIERPTVYFSDDFMPPLTTNENHIKIPFKFSNNSKQFEIYANGVLLKKETVTNEKQSQFDFVLHSGENNISIIAKDKNQIESEPLSFKIVNKNAPKSKVYYVGVGISTYKDSTMNLKYAVKDVEKLEEYFTMRYKNDSIQVIKLLNEEVSSENIKTIKEMLSKTNVDDKVIISFSGHGLINNEKEFYFAGYDTDFSVPEKQSISYELIQSLTDNIPARKRLILIDACHSGSLDSEEDLSVLNNNNIKEHDIKGSIVVKGKKATTLESFEQMQNMFFNLNKSNGTIIIAASGGKEYAYEGKDWNNGVFTFSLIQTLQEKGYDTWKGSVGVPVSVLQKEVYKKVSNYTSGKQKPTARSENPEWDWEL